MLFDTPSERGLLRNISRGLHTPGCERLVGDGERGGVGS
jgi:hypothetical protein